MKIINQCGGSNEEITISFNEQKKIISSNILQNVITHSYSQSGAMRSACWLILAWWRHKMETFSASMGLCVGNSPVTGEFPSQRPVTRSFDVFFDLRLNKQSSKQSWGWWFETLWRSLWRHTNGIIFIAIVLSFYIRSWANACFLKSSTACWSFIGKTVILNIAVVSYIAFLTIFIYWKFEWLIAW